MIISGLYEKIEQDQPGEIQELEKDNFKASLPDESSCYLIRQRFEKKKKNMQGRILNN